MSDFRFFVNICQNNNFFDALGDGPLESATTWRYTSRLDGAGRIECEISASDPQAEYVTNRRALRALALLDGGWTEVGIGIIDNIETVPSGNGDTRLRLSGLDIVGELNYRSVHDLEIGEDTGATHADSLATLNTYAPAGWSFAAAASPGNDYFHRKFNGESVLSAIIYLANATQTHFYRSAWRALVFDTAFSSSGIHAVAATQTLTANNCAITSLSKRVDTHELLTRIYPLGSGEDRYSSLDLSATTRTALDLPAGYSFNAASNYIQNDTAIADYGLVDFPNVSFKEIGPISNTAADYEAAANMLFDVALAELQFRSTLDTQTTYDLTVAGCSALLRPLQTLRVTYRDPARNIDIDETLYILESTWEMDARGIRTSRLKVSTFDRWPKNANDNAAERVVQERIYQAHPQIALNEWWENGVLIVGDDQTNHVAEFPFVLGPSVVTVRQVVFRFKIESVLGIVKSYTLSDTETEQNAAENTGETQVTIEGKVVEINTTAVTVTADTPTDIGTTLLPTIATRTDSSGTTPETVNSGTNSAAGDPHTHDITSHQHIYEHDHFVLAEHGHTSPPHNHVADSHDHTSPVHTHTSPQHVHTVPTLVETVELERASALNTYALADLEYSVNGGGWVSLDTATGTGDDYFQLDVTVDITDPAVPYRPAQASGNNVIQVRRKTAAGTGKTAMLLCKLGVRTTIRGTAIG